MSDTTYQFTVTTGDGKSGCDCNLHRIAPLCGLAPEYVRVLELTMSVIAPGLSVRSA